MKRSIWSKPSLLRDFAVLSALIVFVLMLVSLWVTYFTYLDRSRYTLHSLEVDAARMDRQMIIKVEHASYLLESLGRQIAQMDARDLSRISPLLRSLDTIATQHDVFSWINDKGSNVVSSVSGVHVRPVDVTDRNFFQLAQTAPWRVHIGSPIEGRVSHKHVLPVALGVTDGTGKFLGVILVSLDIEVITHELENTLKGSGNVFALYTNDELITRGGTADSRLTTDTIDTLFKSVNTVKQPSGIIRTGNFWQDLSTHIYYETSARFPYTIVLGVDSRADITAVKELLVPRLLQIVILGIFMLTLLWVVRVHILRPVTELAEITSGVLRGQAYHRPSRSGAGEVVELTQQIKYLADYISEERRLAEEKDNKNITLLKAKENAELSNNVKTEFLAAMSHGLRTPLNAIIGFSEIIKNQLYGPLENTQYWQYAQDIHRSAQHLQVLIDDVLALSNAESSLSQIDEKPLEVSHLLNRCLRLVSEKLQDLKVQVDIKSPESLPKLLMDEGRFLQIVIQLLVQAAQAARNGHILMEAYIEKNRANDEFLCIAFISYPPSVPTSVKQPEKITSPVGLPLVKALVAMHQAVLENSRIPGKSSTLLVRFPQERIVY